MGLAGEAEVSIPWEAKDVTEHRPAPKIPSLPHFRPPQPVTQRGPGWVSVLQANAPKSCSKSPSALIREQKAPIFFMRLLPSASSSGIIDVLLVLGVRELRNTSPPKLQPYSLL